jgi:hypothetical protein
MASILENLITSITFKSAYGPTVPLNNPFAPAPPSPFMQVFKPRIEIGIKGTDPIIIQPYGDPGTTKWPLVAAALTLGAGVGIGFLGLGVLSIVRGAPPKRMKSTAPLGAFHGRRAHRRTRHARRRAA